MLLLQWHWNKIVVMNRRIAVIFIVAIYAVTILSFIWMTGTHAIVNGNRNYSPVAFSFGNVKLAYCCIPIIGLALILYPWFWKFRYGNSDNSCNFNLFPCRGNKTIRWIGMILSFAYSFVAVCAIALTLFASVYSSWYMEEDLGLMLFCYTFFGFLALLINISFGVFSPKNYNKL